MKGAYSYKVAAPEVGLITQVSDKTALAGIVSCIRTKPAALELENLSITGVMSCIRIKAALELVIYYWSSELH